MILTNTDNIKKIAFKNFRSSKCDIKSDYWKWKDNAALQAVSPTETEASAVKPFPPLLLHISLFPLNMPPIKI